MQKHEKMMYFRPSLSHLPPFPLILVWSYLFAFLCASRPDEASKEGQRAYYRSSLEMLAVTGHWTTLCVPLVVVCGIKKRA